MYNFIACDKGILAPNTDPELIEIFAISRKEAVAAAHAAGINDPVIRLSKGVDPLESWASHDPRLNLLTVHLAPKEDEATSYLQKEFGFRFRENEGYLSALWTPEREDAIRLDCSMQVRLFDGIGSRVAGVDADYFKAVAAQYLLHDSVDSREVWRRLQVLKADYARLDPGVEPSPESLHLPANLRAHRLRNALSYRIRFLEALLHLSPVNVSEFPKLLKSGSQVKIGGEWLTVLRVNEKTVKVGPMNAEGGSLVSLDQIEEIKLGDPPPDFSSPPPPINPGDYVRHLGKWYRVSSATDDTVFIEGRTRVRAIGRHRIGGIRTSDDR